ncbi:aldehyde dehydrogenase family protein [Dactylosporangium aurantiacum]|uniref:aldehyde dehydrogenase (NAD(+)) n=1 Tax=Dactylosporangium aurantiacum TaxID=35754 RepID=A0A9Q9IKH9_9ACTN|nr:aldehyde dehydrogenase family protein [Dactylosporangium aurantiacum]MDG6107393.1 aldehyde dehydrogenase family protein [Dactylosporangium aurantiacum]UWZ54480.1 aldehyde dehydrogenase family protein [Dactylosporangium aurantiacum]
MSTLLVSTVGGRSVDAPGEARFVSTDPARLDQVVAEVALADADTFVAACRSARRAQRDWADVPAPVRGRVIANLGRLVEANFEALAALVTREVGKTAAEARGEVQEIVDTCDFFLGEGRRMYGQTVPSEMPDKQLFTFRVPVGVAAIITAGNFPVAVPSWYLVPALLCGNAVVWKPAEYSAACADAFAQLIRRAGVPDGVFDVVYADGATTYAGLERALDAGLVDKIGFTGSSEVGARIGELAGRHLQSACLELGGKNPMIVTEDADLDLAVHGALFAGFGTAGQRCTSLGTLIVHDSVLADFTARLEEAVRRAPIGDPTDPSVLYGPLMTERFAARFEDYLGWVEDHHRVPGPTGRISAASPREGFVGDPENGLFYHPVLVHGVRPEDKIFQQETFGPLVGVTGYTTLDEAIELADAPGYGLSAAIYTTDPRKAFTFRRRTRAGMVSVNNSTSGAEAHLPFGGNGKSGNGSRQSGVWVLDQFTRWQSMNWDYSGRLQRAQMDTLEITPDLEYRLSQ